MGMSPIRLDMFIEYPELSILIRTSTNSSSQQSVHLETSFKPGQFFLCQTIEELLTHGANLFTSIIVCIFDQKKGNYVFMFINHFVTGVKPMLSHRHTDAGL